MWTTHNSVYCSQIVRGDHMVMVVGGISIMDSIGYSVCDFVNLCYCLYGNTMNLQTKHKKIKYRNGEEGFLITSQRESSTIPVMSLRFNGDSLLYHNIDGKYMNLTIEHPYDIVEIES